MARGDLVFDYKNSLSEKVGPREGLTIHQIKSLGKTVKTIQKGLNNLRRLGQLPFLDLPLRE
ncbi:MAG: hypothetical protein Q7S00_02310, partial [bacterium]|nr:hypothetical protein [bacterium]